MKSGQRQTVEGEFSLRILWFGLKCNTRCAANDDMSADWAFSILTWPRMWPAPAASEVNE